MGTQAWVMLAAALLVTAVFVLAWYRPRRRPANPHSVAELRARENADNLPKYPSTNRPSAREWRDR